MLLHNSSVSVLRLHGPAVTAVDFYPKGCTFMSIFLVFVCCSYYIYFIIISVTFLSFPKTGKTVGHLCLVAMHNQMLFIYTNVIPLFYGLILFYLCTGWDNEGKICLLLFANKFFDTTLFICLSAVISRGIK